MKKITTLLTMLLLCAASFAQKSSDDPMFFNSSKGGGPIAAPEASTKSIAVSGVVAPCDGGPTTLDISGASCGSYSWYDDSIGTTLLATDTALVTGPLMNDTTFYLQSTTPISPTNMVLPPHGSTFSGNVRGYWYQAPISFYITGFVVPTDASTGTSNVAVVRFNSGPPPLWSTTTNDFTLLGYWANSTDDTISTCIAVSAGDYIGILGNRANQNSYATAPYASSIDGNAVTLTRLGMQASLSTTSPANLFQEPSGSLSRVHMLYSTTLTPGTIEPVDVIVPTSYSGGTASMSACDGDSVMINGNWESTSGIYPDSLVSIYGCDSIINVDLQIGSSYAIADTAVICPGDSVEMGGVYYSTPNTYMGNLFTVQGCDSTVFLTVQHDIVDASVSVAGITITAAATGTYTWVDCDNGYSPITGETGQSFTPTANGNYAVIVDDGLCQDTSACTAITTIGLDELFTSTIHIAPNPTSGELTIQLGEVTDLTVEVRTVRGRLVQSNAFETVDHAVIQIDEPAGYYFVTIRNNEGQEGTFKVVKK